MCCKYFVCLFYMDQICIESAAKTKATTKQHTTSHTKCVKFLHVRARVLIHFLSI